MFSSTLRATLVALAATASVVSAAPSLSLKVSGPDSVDGVQNLKVSTTLTNTGDETLKLLNDPRSALHSLPANTFSITTGSGQRPQFIGVKAKYVPSKVAKSSSPKLFTVLAPGQSVTIEHDLSAAYNFTLPGEGKYTVEAANLFHYLDPKTNEPVPIHADAETHVAAVSGKLAVTHARSITKRAQFEGCSSEQQDDINTAIPAVQSYVSDALTYLQDHTSASTRYTTWFGAYTDSRHSTVLDHFTKLNGNDFDSFTFDCDCDEEGVFAYVNPDDFGYITLCPAFWDAPNTGTDSRAGTIVHESSHFTANGGTDDHVYGQSGAQNLARTNPAQAVDNADSHEYFAENNPSLD